MKTIFSSWRKMFWRFRKFRNFEKSEKSENFRNFRDFRKFSKIWKFSRFFEILKIFINEIFFEIFEIFQNWLFPKKYFHHDKKIFFIQIFFLIVHAPILSSEIIWNTRDGFGTALAVAKKKNNVFSLLKKVKKREKTR